MNDDIFETIVARIDQIIDTKIDKKYQSQNVPKIEEKMTEINENSQSKAEGKKQNHEELS